MAYICYPWLSDTQEYIPKNMHMAVLTYILLIIQSSNSYELFTHIIPTDTDMDRDHIVHAPSQWETTLHL